METLVDKRLITREEYHKMAESGILSADEKVELINGEIVNKMSPIGIKHVASLNRLSYLLRNFYHDRYWINTQNPLHINDLSEPEPDLAIVNFKDDFYESGHPTSADVLFLVEIADSTLEFDSTVKKELYANAGIAEYWIVDVNGESVTIYSELVANRYTKSRHFGGSGQGIKVPDTDRYFELGELFPQG